MEDQVQSLLATLKRSSVAIDTKLAAFNSLRSNIKHQCVPDACQATIFECIRLAISSQTSPTLVSTAFSTLGHLIKRLSLQEQTGIIAAHTPKLLPILQDRLGDSRESVRNVVSQTLCDLWPLSKVEVERVIRDGAFGGNNARSKEMAMLWVVKMNKAEGLQFKSFVPSLVACLEDPDGGVRETAKSCVVELFRTAPEHAKADLKRQMAARDVRKTIVSFIVHHLGIRNSAEVDVATSVVSLSTASTETHTDLNESVLSEHPNPETVALDPLYLHTQRELDDAFKEMMPAFEGRETEHNWLARDKSIRKIRRLLKGNAPADFPVAFVAGIKSMLDNIIKITNTLRTTMSTNACQLVQELYRTLGAAMDPMTDICIQNFVKMSAATKQISGKNADTSMETILSNCSYSHRLMNHMWLTFQEKNVQTRSFAPNWLKVLMKKNASHKTHVEHTGGVELIEKCLKKGLGDASPKVRENTRGAYWVFAQIWPDQAGVFINKLDDKMRVTLERDANNPNKVSLASSVSSVSSTTARPAGQMRSSVRDAIAAQRRAALANNPPERPTSAQSIFATTDAPSARHPPRPAGRTPSALSTATADSAHAPAAQRALAAAPVRRPRRQELNRPATADPYATRRLGNRQTTPITSPQTSPSKTGTVKGSAAASRAVGRTPARPAATTAASTIRGKPRSGTGPSRTSPRDVTHIPTLASSPSKDENMTIVVPFTRPPDDGSPQNASIKGPFSGQIGPRDSVATRMSEDDTSGFTMVLPNLRSEPFDRHMSSRPSSSGSPGRSSLPRRSPIKLHSETKVGSPLAMRKQAPKSQSPERLGAADSAEAPVQVYEDPFVGDEQVPPSAKPAKPVLEEIAINERSSDVERENFTQDLSQSTRSNEQNLDGQRTPRGHHKTTSTGSILGANNDSDTMQTSAETMRSRRLLTSAIERVRAKTLEAHGFRRVQEIVKSNGNQDIWGEDAHKFGELLVALLEYLESPAEALKVPGAKVQNLKTQVLSTVRAMLAIHKKEAAPYHARALKSILVARRQFDEMSHITAEMERVADEIVRNGQPAECINCVLDLVEGISTGATSPNASPPTSPLQGGTSSNGSPIPGGDVPGGSPTRTLTMSLAVLASLLATAAGRKVPLTATQTKRLGNVAARLLQDTDPEVRRADLEFCLALHERLGGENGEGFWKAVEGAKESGLNLITYYLARKGKAGR